MEQRGVCSGFRFHPTDMERLTFLQKFMEKQEMNDSGFITTNIDVYDSEEEPWMIYSRGVPCGAADYSLYRCFITKKSSNLGNWKLQDEGKSVHRDSSSSTVVIGCKKKMRYMVYNNEEHREDDVHYWLMKEYKLSNVILRQFDDDRRDYVLCAIKKKFIETRSSEMENVSGEFGAIQLLEKEHSGFRALARDEMPRHFQTATHVDKVTILVTF
ncbi:NAC domain-containing protein 78-like [Capsicum annuum]|uniref:NAC domain-containing protein 78-like n=1 Tax=Capsicum annuum TaxID=4072 RepID=UPI001FB0D632|nr:NAC domain-containing protein 78-like [Capsicum annuum]